MNMQRKPSARLLLADDHRLLADACRSLLEPEYQVVGVETDGRSLVKSAITLKPDMVILDIAMPHLNGLDAAQQIKQKLPSTKLVFMTMNQAPEVAADPAIAVEAVFERDRLDFVAQIRLRPLRRSNLAKAIETGARYAAGLAQMLDRGGALRLQRVHFFNDRVDGVARDDRSRASMSRKAARKKSRAICCLPILRGRRPA